MGELIFFAFLDLIIGLFCLFPQCLELALKFLDFSVFVFQALLQFINNFLINIMEFIQNLTSFKLRKTLIHEPIVLNQFQEIFKFRSMFQIFLTNQHLLKNWLNGWIIFRKFIKLLLHLFMIMIQTTNVIKKISSFQDH